SVYTIGSQVVTANPTGFAIAPETTLRPGRVATISGTRVSLDSSGNLVIGSSTARLSGPTQSVFTVGDQVFTAYPLGLNIGGQTLFPNGRAITIADTRVSLDGLGNLNIDSSTIHLADLSTTQSVFTVGGQTITANYSGFTIGSQTLSPNGSAITVSGTRLSLDASGNLIIGTSSIHIPIPSITQSNFTVGGQVFTAKPSGFTIGDKTLLPKRPAITISGTYLSLDGAGDLIIGSSTVHLSNPTNGDDLGGAILSGSRAGSTSMNGCGHLQTFEGMASQRNWSSVKFPVLFVVAGAMLGGWLVWG
ncbi:MAG: hypothetical protein M1812_004274, partial [Candelaria pacifica]